LASKFNISKFSYFCRGDQTLRILKLLCVLFQKNLAILLLFYYYFRLIILANFKPNFYGFSQFNDTVKYELAPKVICPSESFNILNLNFTSWDEGIVLPAVVAE